MEFDLNIPLDIDQFFLHYRDTISLVDQLLLKEKGSQDIILLICSRLDSLANLAFSNVAGQKTSFIELLNAYSGQRDFFTSISIGNLFHYLSSFGEIADGGLIQKAGRIRRIGRNSEDFIKFIESSQIAITGKAVEQLAARICHVLQKNFRVKPYQRKNKPYTAYKNQILDIINSEFRSPPPRTIITAIDQLLEKFKVSSILYEVYRCEIIHGFRVQIDEEEFFNHKEPFFSVYHSPFTGNFYNIVFPGAYLRNLLSKCLTTYISHLKAKKKVPPVLINDMFDPDEKIYWEMVDYMDDDQLDDFADVKWDLRNR